MLLRTFELFLFVADLLGVLTWQSRAGDPGHISGLNGSDEWFVALADNTHHLHLVGLKKIQRKLGNLYVEDVGIMVWHGSPFDNSVELFLVFSETLRMWPRCCLGTSTESHQKASRSSASKWRSYLGKKKNVKTADRLDRTHSMDQHDGHTLRRTASSVPNHAIAAKMAATTSAAKDVCKHGKNAWKVQKPSHASHSLGSAPRPLDGLRCSSSSRGKATIWMPISNQEQYNAIPSRLCFRWP